MTCKNGRRCTEVHFMWFYADDTRDRKQKTKKKMACIGQGSFVLFACLFFGTALQ